MQSMGVLLRTHCLLCKKIPTCFALKNASTLPSIDQVLHLPENKQNDIIYPIRNVERYLITSAKKTEHDIFDPNLDDIKKAEKFFIPSARHQIDYFTSAVRINHAPQLTAPEVCFIGRSNVGKSSLIKALFAFCPPELVKVSKNPSPRDFTEMVEAYLEERPNLKRTFLLVDGCVGVQNADLVALEMCEELAIPYVLVVTKIDRAPKGELLKNVMQIQETVAKQTQGCFPQLFLVSSLHFHGIHLLRSFIAHVTGNLPLSNPNGQ